MDDQLISLFIDDELEFEEKIAFVAAIRDDDRFAAEAMAMLGLERQLIEMVDEVRDVLPKRIEVREPTRLFFADLLADWFRPAAGFVTALVLVAIVLPFLPKSGLEHQAVMENHRFVLYHPDSTEAKIVGSFTGWKPVIMQRAGNSGYWSVTLPLPPGEHRYSFLLEDHQSIPDPSIGEREMDDFGGENSVITVGYNHEPVS